MQNTNVLLVEPFFEEGGGGLENFGQKLKYREFFNWGRPLIVNTRQYFVVNFENNCLKPSMLFLDENAIECWKSCPYLF